MTDKIADKIDPEMLQAYNAAQKDVAAANLALQGTPEQEELERAQRRLKLVAGTIALRYDLRPGRDGINEETGEIMRGKRG